MFQSYVALAVFLAAYGLFVVLPNRRSLVSVAAACVLVLFGTIPLHELPGAINWNVMGIFVGMLAMADIFIESRCPAYLAEHIVNKAPNTAWALLFICALSSALSAFVENVATVLIVAPIALEMMRRLKMNPVPVMMGIAISSNLQGAATLIGDPPSMLLGGYAKMNFMDFFFYQGKPSIFFAVEIGAVASMVVLYYAYRGIRGDMNVVHEEEVKSWVPTIALVALIAALAASSFFDTEFSYLAGLLCMVFGVGILVWARLSHKTPILPTLKRLDWDTTFFLMGIFVVVESLTHTGWIDATADWLSHQVGDNLFLGYTLLVFLSIFVSAFVDNVPYLAAMLPVGGQMAATLGVDPSLLLFGLLIGASLGGNITPIGASANIVATGMLKKEGHIIGFGEWARLAVPFTFAAVIPAYLLVWFLWR